MHESISLKFYLWNERLRCFLLPFDMLNMVKIERVIEVHYSMLSLDYEEVAYIKRHLHAHFMKQ